VQHQTLIIRPSGMWDSRAPFHTYLFHHRNRLRTYGALTLGIQRLRVEAEATPAEPLSRKFFRVKQGGHLSDKAWRLYTKSFATTPNGDPERPTLQQVFDDLANCFWATTAWSVVDYAGLFEVFGLSWLLNYLLARLESGAALTRDELRLASQISPLRKRLVLPPFPTIVSAIPMLEDGLKALPHVRTDPRTSQEVSTPITETLNALRTLEFWRDYRNLFVHHAGMVSLRFAGKHRAFVEDLRSLMPEIPSLAVGQRIQLRDDSFRAMSSVHYRAAQWMNEQLVALSGGRRGHPFAPSPVPALPWTNVPPKAPSLLVEGDHPESYRWVVDPSFRLSYRNRNVAAGAA